MNVLQNNTQTYYDAPVMPIKTMLEALAAAGKTDGEIAIVIDKSQATVNRLRNGQHEKTDFETGRKIEIFYKMIVKSSAAVS